MKKLIVVSDWADDSLTCQEVRTAVEGFLKDPSNPNITFVSSTPSTIHTSFLISQLSRIEEKYGRPFETVIFQNTDPRIQTKQSVESAEGAQFFIIHLKSGIYICGPNAGYDFSMIKDQIEEVYVYNDLNKGSQFRSRDLYAKICAHLMDAMEDEMEMDEISSNMIPALDGHYIGHIDNFGNIKTTIIHEEFKGKFAYADKVKITINGVTQEAEFVNNLFGGVPGKLVIYPGSSGLQDNPYMEISVWRHFTEEDTSTGIHAFKNPKPGDEIEIEGM